MIAVTGQHNDVILPLLRALEREMHVLTTNPELLWQQLYNRLQWEGESVKQAVAPELSHRISSDTRPWARLRIPLRESQSLVRTLEGHNGYVNSCAVSPDGQWIVSASEDHTLRVWESSTGRLLRTMGGHTAGVKACAISPDSKWILSASKDKDLRIWDLATGQTQQIIHGMVGEINDCAISPNCRLICFAGDTGNVIVWDLVENKKIRELSGHKGFFHPQLEVYLQDIFKCVFSPNGKFILSVGIDKSVKFWDIQKGRELFTVDNSENTCAIGPDGAWFVTACNSNKLKICDVVRKGKGRFLEGHRERVSALGISPDGKWMVSASSDMTLKVWNVANAEELQTFEGHSSWVNDCAISPDGTWIVSASNDKTLKIWNVANIFTGRQGDISSGHAEYITDCTFSPNGDRVISASWDKTIKIWESASGQVLGTLRGHKHHVLGCSMSPDSKWIISSARYENVLKIWDAVRLKESRTLSTFSGGVTEGNACTFSSDGRWVVFAEKADLYLFTSNGQLRCKLSGHRGEVSGCAFSPDGTWIVSASKDCTLKIWDTNRGHELRTLQGHAQWVFNCAVSPDGSWIVSASWDNTLKIWNAASGQELSTLKGHKNRVNGCAVSPDGSWIVSASDDSTLKVWNVVSGTEVLSIPLLGSVQCVATHPHQPMVVCGDAGGNLYFIDLMGIEYDPIIVTASRKRQAFILRCPACQQDLLVRVDQLGNRMMCPTIGCKTQLKVNTITIQ
jgi:WD40 repeat protein